jgi:hypothetical protein
MYSFFHKKTLYKTLLNGDKRWYINDKRHRENDQWVSLAHRLLHKVLYSVFLQKNTIHCKKHFIKQRETLVYK